MKIIISFILVSFFVACGPLPEYLVSARDLALCGEYRAADQPGYCDGAQHVGAPGDPYTLQPRDHDLCGKLSPEMKPGYCDAEVYRTKYTNYLVERKRQ
ncbi:MAG: hypothetical protein IID41_00350 [Planctomycetes bacterium]|nr:hypothetical protein [Planctomycetota bacterium]